MAQRINSKNKGGKNEREICKYFKEWSGFEFSRVPGSGGLRWKKTDNITGDIISSDPDHPGPFPLSVEGKSYNDLRFEHVLIPDKKRVRIFDFWDQTVADAERGKKIPICFIRYNSLPKQFWFVLMDYNQAKKIRKKLPKKYVIIKTENVKLVIISSTYLRTINYQQFLKLLPNGK